MRQPLIHTWCHNIIFLLLRKNWKPLLRLQGTGVASKYSQISAIHAFSSVLKSVDGSRFLGRAPEQTSYHGASKIIDTFATYQAPGSLTASDKHNCSVSNEDLHSSSLLVGVSCQPTWPYDEGAAENAGQAALSSPAPTCVREAFSEVSMHF
jgi:hypothetical protein